MPVTNYYTVNGQLIGESTNGVRTQYIRDALGSVIATTDGAGNIQNTYRYTPYGGTTYKTGTAPDPKFLFAGTWGGRQTGRAHSEEYWRARHRSEPETTWTTVDPVWPVQLPYGYVSGSPIGRVDPNGLDYIVPNTCRPQHPGSRGENAAGQTFCDPLLGCMYSVADNSPLSDRWLPSTRGKASRGAWTMLLLVRIR